MHSSQDASDIVADRVSKHHEDYGEELKFVAEDGTEVVQGMWTQADFAAWLQHTRGADDGSCVFRDHVQPQLISVAKASLLAAQPDLGGRERSWEIFGFDFMVDDQLNVWLIEVNASPATDFSTAVTARYVPAAVGDSVKVVLDHAAWARDPESNSAPPDTGGWKRIHDGQLAARPNAVLSIKLETVGKGLRPALKALPSPEKKAALEKKRARQRHAVAVKNEEVSVARHLARQAAQRLRAEEVASLPAAKAKLAEMATKSRRASPSPPRMPVLPRPEYLPTRRRSADGLDRRLGATEAQAQRLGDIKMLRKRRHSANGTRESAGAQLPLPPPQPPQLPQQQPVPTVDRKPRTPPLKMPKRVEAQTKGRDDMVLQAPPARLAGPCRLGAPSRALAPVAIVTSGVSGAANCSSRWVPVRRTIDSRRAISEERAKQREAERHQITEQIQRRKGSAAMSIRPFGIAQRRFNAAAGARTLVL